jgi:hypothetical protein
VPPTYASGEIVRKGDQIRYAGDPGEVEFVADPDVVDATTAWYVEQFGAGCMIATEKWGSIFLHATEQEEDLEFVSRSGSE